MIRAGNIDHVYGRWDFL